MQGVQPNLSGKRTERAVFMICVHCLHMDLVLQSRWMLVQRLFYVKEAEYHADNVADRAKDQFLSF